MIPSPPEQVCPPIVVEAPAGSIVGRLRDGVAQFRSVPFAEAPVGERRFARPRRRSRFRTPFDASEWGPTPQGVPYSVSPRMPEPSIAGDDILSLTIYAPPPGRARREAAEPLPVLVWIHGGGYRAGAPTGDWYDGRSFVRDGVLLVVPSYRLGFEGFGWLPDAPTNRGVADWVCALEWVRDNISAFGGDPRQVTVAGQSAGAGAVLHLLASPSSAGLLHAAWASSPPIRDRSVPEAREFTRLLAAVLGVSPDRVGFGGCTRSEIEEASREISPPAGVVPASILPFTPLAGDDLLPDALLRGLGLRSRRVPLVVGANQDEFVRPGETALEVSAARRTLEAWGVEPGSAPRYLARVGVERGMTSGRLLGDTLFRASVPVLGGVRGGPPPRGGEDAGPSSPAGTAQYEFRRRSPLDGRAGHGDDIPFLFDLLDSAKASEVLGPHPSRELAGRMHGDLVSLARHHRVPWTGTIRLYGDPAGDADPGAYEDVSELAAALMSS